MGSGGVVGDHSTGIVKSAGVVVGRKGTAGAVHWIDGEHWPIDTTFFVAPKRREISQPFAYFLLRDLGLSQMNNDSAVPGLNRNDAHARRVRIPALEQIVNFSLAADPLIELSAQLARETQSLAATRDALLPQLISGKLRVRDAEQVLSEAV